MSKSYLIFHSLSLLLDAAMAAAAGSVVQLLLATKSWQRADLDQGRQGWRDHNVAQGAFQCKLLSWFRWQIFSPFYLPKFSLFQVTLLSLFPLPSLSPFPIPFLIPISDTFFIPISGTFIPISDTFYIPFSNTFYPSFCSSPFPGHFYPLHCCHHMHSCTVLCSQRQNTTQQRLTRMYFSPLVSGHQSSCWLWSTFYPLTLANSIFVIITKRVLQCAHVRDSTYRSSL